MAKASAVGLDDTFATFNGSSNYFRAPDNDIFDVTGNITVSAWIRPASICASSECVFVAKDENYLFGIVNGTFQFALRPASGSWPWIQTGVRPILNQWQHVSFAVARSNNRLTMYLNGRQVFVSTSVPATSYPSDREFSIGARSLTSWRSFFNGSIDEVRVYNTTRESEAEAQADMNTWGPADTTGLVLYYDFNEGSGSTLNNRVTGASTATNLTAVGGPTWHDAKSTTTSGATITITFSRTYLTRAGGWTPPTGLTQARALIVAGGGGGGSSYSVNGTGAGGGGAGGLINRWTSGSVSIGSSAMPVIVGGGGLGGWRSTDETGRNGAFW